MEERGARPVETDESGGHGVREPRAVGVDVNDRGRHERPLGPDLGVGLKLAEAPLAEQPCRDVGERTLLAGRGEEDPAVAEGRDMGTVVFPDAPHKFFLTADLGTRAARRAAELAGAGQPAPTLDEVARDIAERDARDSGRETAPLRQADDAVAIDTSGLGVDAVIETLLRRIRDAER